MATYTVLRPIEHDKVLYLPALSDALERVPSRASGEPIPVNARGVIELTEKQAAALVDGQVAPLGDAAKPASARRPEAPADGSAEAGKAAKKTK